MAQATNEDRLYLLDASGSMNDRLDGKRKIDIVKEGLSGFCLQRWPASYYDVPLRVGLVSFRLLGFPGATKFDVLIPLYPPPVSLELYLIDELAAKGGSWVSDGLRYAAILIKESERGKKRVDFISDGSFEGPDPLPIAEEIHASGAVLNSVEIAKEGTKPMQEIAQRGGGQYHLVKNVSEFSAAIQ